MIKSLRRSAKFVVGENTSNADRAKKTDNLTSVLIVVAVTFVVCQVRESSGGGSSKYGENRGCGQCRTSGSRGASTPLAPKIMQFSGLLIGKCLFFKPHALLSAASEAAYLSHHAIIVIVISITDKI